MDHPFILHIESSGDLCHVALSHGLQLIASKSTEVPKKHIGQLAILVNEILHANSLLPQNLDVVSLSSGPGSYTGLRVAFALTKGMVFGNEIRVVLIPTYESLLYDQQVLERINNQPAIVVLHARKEEYIKYEFGPDQKLIRQQDINYSELVVQVNKSDTVWISDRLIEGVAQVKFVNRSATNLIKPAYRRWINRDFVDAHTISPIYYKPPYITQPKRKLI